MSDIFISYKPEDQATARKLANALESEGWTVWDPKPKVRAGERFSDEVEKAFSEAKCVIVLWSKRSVESQYVKDEATHALKRNKLVPVMIEEVELPFRFEDLQTLSLLGWDGSKNSMGFRRLVEDISAILGPSATAVAAAEEQRRLETEERQKAEEERLREQERQRSEEEARRKADEEKEKTRPQRRPGIGTYDVFISFKNTDENGVPTRDAELANEVYNFLTSKGLKVFISTATLESLGVSDYTKAINDALDAASIVVAVGTSAENLDSEWVRYEWGSFYNDILSRKKPGGKVFTYILGLRPAQLPRTLRQTQTFIHSPQSLGQLHGFIVQALR